ncbi:MAG: hypothetical protein ACREWG_06775 [Gammaproteobacteria bacterium]
MEVMLMLLWPSSGGQSLRQLDPHDGPHGQRFAQDIETLESLRRRL